MTISQSAIEAAAEALGNDVWDGDLEDLPPEMHREAQIALEAAMPHIRAQIAQEIRADLPPPTTALKAHKAARIYLELAAQKVDGETP